MAMLGKSLVFYLKYCPEMDRLYWAPKESGERPDMAGLADAERILQMVGAVGDAACREVADFLSACADRVEGYFSGLPGVEVGKRSKRSTTESEWWVGLSLSAGALPGRGFGVGVTVQAETALVVPWLWGHGGRAGEDAIMGILGTRAHSRSGEGLVGDRGSVALAPVPIQVGSAQGFEIDREPLVEKVYEAFAAITAANVKAIIRSPAGGK